MTNSSASIGEASVPRWHRGTYGPGSFVWFPEGGVMYHGATEDRDVTFLFITNNAFDIHFVGDESDPCAPTMR